MSIENNIGNREAMTLQTLLDDLRTVVQDSESLLRAGAQRLAERTRSRARVTGDAVRDKPYSSLGIVFGAGLVAGLLLCGFRSRRRVKRVWVRRELP